MGLPEIMFAVIIGTLSLFLAAAGFYLQRHRYWRQVWEDLGKPEVDSMAELKALRREKCQGSSFVPPSHPTE